MRREPQNLAFVSRREEHGNSWWAKIPRGGESTASGGSTTVAEPEAVAAGTGEGQSLSLDEKVQAAMRKLGLTTPPSLHDEGECEDGVCPLPSAGASSSNAHDASSSSSLSTTTSSPSVSTDTVSEDPTEMANRIAKDMNVDGRLSMAAVGATATTSDSSNRKIFNESAARAMIQQELDLIGSIPPDSPKVRILTDEGHDAFLSRRALAFVEDNLEDARAILLADEMDADEEDQLREDAADIDASPAQALKSPDFVEVKANFDPTKLPTTGDGVSSSSNTAKTDNSMPKPAPKESVVFEATTAQIQELVLESPVPVLLDIYADW